MEASEPKQVIVIRRDLGMRRGKEIAQGAHAAMEWLIERWKKSQISRTPLQTSALENAWMLGLYKKVVLQVPDEAELMKLHHIACGKGLLSHVIMDAGLTEFKGIPKMTALAIGPNESTAIDAITQDCKLY